MTAFKLPLPTVIFSAAPAASVGTTTVIPQSNIFKILPSRTGNQAVSLFLPPAIMVHVITQPPTEATRHQIVWLAGPRLVGLLFNWGLLGVLTAQVYIYHVSFPKDKRIMKFLVYLVYLLDWAQTFSATYDAFQWFVWGWGDIPGLFLRYSGFLNVPLLSSTIGAIVQASYLPTCRKLIIPVVICVLALLQLGAGISTSYYMFQDASEMAREPSLVLSVSIRMVGVAVVDTVISVAMTYFLLRSRAQALGPLNNFMTRLVRLTVETGTITVIAAILDLAFYLKEHNGLHQASGVILGKMYSNTFLVLFNNRLVDWNNTEAYYSPHATGFKLKGGPGSVHSGDTADFPTYPRGTPNAEKEAVMTFRGGPGSVHSGDTADFPTYRFVRPRSEKEAPLGSRSGPGSVHSADTYDFPTYRLDTPKSDKEFMPPAISTE
ncbi:hypothetical protein DFH09DRAFT_1080080 [Mycena vulgaris]|nr:hypothetical protein DFH09DRAFT_1080080 [Mycena vulgaris]